jgi:hypothetical protein
MTTKRKLNVFVTIILALVGFVIFPIASVHATCPADIFAYWPLDEVTPGAYEDFIKGNDGAGSNSPAAATGRVSGAQSFDSTNSEQIEVLADNSFDWQADESFSIEVWVNTPATNIPAATESKVIVGRGGGSGDSLQWWIGINDEGLPTFILVDSAGNDPGSGNRLIGVGTAPDDSIADGQWHHVVAVRDKAASADGDIILYVDGDEKGRKSFDYAADFSSADAPITIGAIAGTLFFDGLIDEVALYDRALLPDEIIARRDAGLTGTGVCAGAAPFTPFPDDTISLWPLDEVTPGAYADAFDGNDGVGSVNPPDPATGLVSATGTDGAQSFDSTNSEQIEVLADNSFDWQADESFSIEVWVNTPATNIPAAGQSKVIVGRGGGSGDSLQWWIGINDEGLPTFVLLDSAGNDPGPGNRLIGVGTAPADSIADGQWHHVVAVRDKAASADGDIILYVDGDEKGRKTYNYAADFRSVDAPITIGSIAGTLYFDGLIDEVALYDRALDGPEIITHRDAGLGGNSVTSLRPEPLAAAGADQTVVENTPVTLDGSGSSDAGGAIVSFLWEQVGTPPVTLTNAATQTATFTAPSVDAAGAVLTFQLTVTDNDGLTHTDTVDVTVEDSTTTTPPPTTTSGGGGGGGCFINSMF